MRRARTPLDWRPARSQSTAVSVEGQIKAALLDGHLQPGDMLGSETTLAAKFGVSRLPIREALGRLQALGAVEIRVGAGGGARVAHGNPMRVAEALAIQLKLSGVSAEQVFDAQYVIEVSAAELAARVADENDIAKMEDALERARLLISRPAEFTTASMEFHQAVVDASHNLFFSTLMSAIIHVLYRSLGPHTTTAIAEGVVARHEKLLDAIRKGNAEKAKQLASAHLLRVRSHFFPD